MHFYQISLYSLAIALAAASPAPPNPRVLHPRDGESKDGYINPEHPKMSLDEQCMFKSGPGFNYWNVVIKDASDFTDETCGSGFLDNVNGRACSPTGWGCHYANDGTTMNAGFKAPLTCGHIDISTAINAAFGGKEVECGNYDDVECDDDGQCTMQVIDDFWNQ